jgi:hypothetical protein
MMLKKEISQQHKCGLDVLRFHTITKGGRSGVVVVYHAKMKWISIIIHKVVPCVGERIKHGLIFGHNKNGFPPGFDLLRIHIIDKAYEFIRLRGGMNSYV